MNSRTGSNKCLTVGNKIYKIQSSVYLTLLSIDKFMHRRWETNE